MADPKFKFYRVRHSNEIVPALRHPAGYEDTQPGDYEGVPDDAVPQDLLDRVNRRTAVAPTPVDPGSSAPPVVVSGSTPAAPPAPFAPPPPPIPVLSPSIVGADDDEPLEDA